MKRKYTMTRIYEPLYSKLKAEAAKKGVHVSVLINDRLDVDSEDTHAKLRDVLHALAASFYYEGSSKEWFDEEIPEWIKEIKAALG